MRRRKVAAALTALTCMNICWPLPATAGVAADLHGSSRGGEGGWRSRLQHMAAHGLFGGATATRDHLAEQCEDEGCPRLPCRMFKDGYRKGYDRGYAEGYAAGYAAGYSAGYGAGFSAGAASATGTG